MNFEIGRMTESDLDTVMSIEDKSHSHPWTRGNFLDSLHNFYWAYVLISTDLEDKPLIGHCILMPGVDELHLLNITVDHSYRRQKIAYRTLQAIETTAIEKKLHKIFLEVRKSNEAAIHLYEHLGYKLVGIRKGYYPSQNRNEINLREDALVMAKDLI